MLAICEECGQRYRIDPEKIKNSVARFKCKNCNHPITVKKQEAVQPNKKQEAAAPMKPDANASVLESNTDGQKPKEKKSKRRLFKTKTEKPSIKGLSIRSKFTLIIIALVLVSLSVAGFIASYQSRKALLEQAEKQLVMVASQKSKEYGLTFARIKDEVLGMADYVKMTYGREGIKDDLGSEVLMPWVGDGYGNPEIDAKLHNEKLLLQRIGLVLKSVVSKNPYLSLGYFATETSMTVFDNKETIDVIRDLDGFQVTERPWYQKAKKAGQIIWTETYVDANTKKLVVTCATPVYKRDKTLAGVVGFDVLLDTIQNDILTLKIGYNSYAFLVNRTGNVLVRPGMNKRDVRWDDTYKTDDLLNTTNAEFNVIIKKMIKGRSGIDTYKSEGEEKYITYAPLKAINAGMAIVASKDEVIKPSVVIIKLIIQVWIAVFLISLLVGLFFGNTITKPINELTMMANDISQGKADLGFLPEKRGDEIGVLSKSFNRLVMSLKLAMAR
jgi:two-component system sensor histidine kinase/response regulator